jgi:hypothetical protein
MNLTNDVAFIVLALLPALGCTSSHRAPVANPPGETDDVTRLQSDASDLACTSPPDPTANDVSASPEVVACAPVRAGGRPAVERPPPSPYRVRIVDSEQDDLRLFHRDGRAYVLGTVGERYAIVLSNPTSRRVEAVVSVDGLDALDGTGADYVRKRGYLVPPFGTTTVDGFRTSLQAVATFRFSSVADSYAGRQGQTRDVGVIGVAFFPERPPPLAFSASRPSVKAAGEGLAGVRDRGQSESRAAAPPVAAAAPQREREGLGTQFGEARESPVEEVDFVRADPAMPASVVVYRYNDRAGLLALGIRVDPPLSMDGEVRTRETADQFRRNRFALPPP